MRSYAPILICRDDFPRLSRIAEEHALEGDVRAARLVRKLRSARVADADELPEDLVRMDAFVGYDIDDVEDVRRALVYPEDRMWPPWEISVLSSVGVELVGRRVGDRISVLVHEDRAPRDVFVRRVGPRLQGGIVRHDGHVAGR